MSVDDGKSGGSGALKIVGVGCLVIIVAAGLVGFVAWQKFRAVGGVDGLIKSGGGQAIEIVVTTVAEQILEGLKIPESDHQAILAPLKGLGQRVVDGDIEAEQLEAFVSSFSEGSIVGVLLAQGFAHSYLRTSNLSGEQLTQSFLTINRFQQGLVNETIDMEQLSALEEYVLEEISDDHYELKDQLSEQDLNNSLLLMKTAADDASIPMVLLPIDIPGMIQNAVDDALETAAGNR